MELSIQNWSAWAPELETREQWESWVGSPHPIPLEGTPSLSKVDARLRRRCSRLSRMMLQAALDCVSDEARSSVCTVFATRHGEIDTTIGLLGDLTRGELLSAHGFSHSVHNTAGGHYSLIAANRNPTASVAGGESTFGAGFLEACMMTQRTRGTPVLLVTGDVPLPAPLDAMDRPRTVPYATALLINRSKVGSRLTFGCEADPGTDQGLNVPHALRFLLWFLTGAGEFSITAGGQRWWWRRT